ncbi:AAA family ATPase, partial [Pseudomonas savastanoi]
MPRNFEQDLAEYFDETFEADSKAVSTLRTNYFQVADETLAQARALLSADCTHLDKDKISLEIQALEALVLVNKDRVEKKVSSPSTKIEFEGVDDIQNGFAEIISAANVKVTEHNRLVASFTAEQSKLTGEVWKYLVETELKSTLTDYSIEKSQLKSAIESISLTRDKAKQNESPLV